MQRLVRWLFAILLILAVLASGVASYTVSAHDKSGPHKKLFDTRWYQQVSGGNYADWMTLSTSQVWLECDGSPSACGNKWSGPFGSALQSWNSKPTTVQYNLLADQNDFYDTNVVITDLILDDPSLLGVDLQLDLSYQLCLATCTIWFEVVVIGDDAHSGPYATSSGRTATIMHELGHGRALAHESVDYPCGQDATGSIPHSIMAYDCIDPVAVGGQGETYIHDWDVCGVNHAYFDPTVGYALCVTDPTPTPSPAPLPTPTSPPGPKPPPGGGAVKNLPGCGNSTLPANDDGSSAAVPIGFPVGFFGHTYTTLFVNNNGNVTFDATQAAYTPFDLLSTARVIIAPFFADADTRGSGSGFVTHGQTSFDGRSAFCVNWINIGYYNSHTDKKNSFQLLLVDRSDTGAGNFDIIFNYDKIQWETGDASSGSGGLGGASARVGYANGIDTSLELPGSAVNGYFLDSSSTGLVHSNRESAVLGRYVFPVRGALPPIPTITPTPVPGAANVRIDPPDQSVPSGTQVVVNLMMADFPDPDGLGAYEVALTWNPNVLTFASFSNGTLLTSSPGVRSVVVLPALLDADGDTVPDVGYARVGVTTFFQTDPPQAPTGDGLLATVRFNTTCAGSTAVMFQRVTLSDPQASSSDIPVNVSGGNANVTGDVPCGKVPATTTPTLPPPAPTGTPLPTPPPGGLIGDASCNGTVDPIDAALILQKDAGLLASLPCAQNADVNHDGHANPLDAALILQYDAGLINHFSSAGIAGGAKAALTRPLAAW